MIKRRMERWFKVTGFSMLFNTAIFAAVVETAKAKSAGNAAMLRAIERAAVELQRAKYWAFDAQTGVLKLQSTTSQKLYVIDEAHTCEATASGHKFCKHTVARRLLQRYAEAVSVALVSQPQAACQPRPAAVPAKPKAPKTTPKAAPVVRQPRAYASPRFQVYGFTVQAETDGATLTFTIMNNGERWTDASPLSTFRQTRNYAQGVLNAMGLRSLYDRLLMEKLLEAGCKVRDLSSKLAPSHSRLAEAEKAVLIHRTPQGYEHVGGIMI